MSQDVELSDAASQSPAPTAGPGQTTEISLNRRSVAGSTVVVLLLVGAFLLALWLYGVIGHFLFLIVLAWLFAAAMDPGVRWLVARGRSRGAATAITGLLLIFAIVVLVVVFGELFVQQAATVLRDLPGLVTKATLYSNEHFNTHFKNTGLLSGLSLQSGPVSSAATSLAGGVFSIVDSLASIILDIVTVLVFGFYIAAAGPHFLASIARGMKPNAQRVFVTVAEITAQKTGGYVGSKIVLASLSAFFHGVLFAIIGVPNWLPYALLVGITAQFIPLIGTYIGVLLPVLATIFDAPWKAIVIIVFAVIYQQLESYVFTPRVSKKTMDVNPAVALAAVFIGAAIWGPIGAVIGIPLVAAVFAIAETFSQRYELIPELAEATAPAAKAK